MEECPICCLNFNKSKNAPVPCETSNCHYVACKDCIRRYLLDSIHDPHCMNCRQVWSQRFIVKHLNKSFIDKDYKEHRVKVLTDIEISKIPETLEFAEKKKKADEIDEKTEEIKLKIIQLKQEIGNLKRKEYELSNKKYKLLYGKGSNEEEKKKFIMPCPNNECKGFLSSQYKCELCNHWTCSKCIEVIGENKEMPHECNENSLQTAEMIKKETKPCPKCGVRIFKISGCDQIWCVECHTAFSWKTGKIEQGVIHNPHYYEYLNKMKKGENVHVNENMLHECNQNLCDYYTLRQTVLSKILYHSTGGYHQNYIKENQDIHNKISKTYRFLIHIQNIYIQPFRENIQNLQDNKDTRVSYILNRITKDEMSNIVYKNDKLRKKISEKLNIYDLFYNVGKDMMNGLMNYPSNDKKQLVNECEKQFNNLQDITKYCNEQLRIISVTYNCSVTIIHYNPISEDWVEDKKKYNLTDIKSLTY